MKTKLTSLLVAFGLITNAAFAGNSANIGYTSDFFYRGEQKALESVQASVKLQRSVLGLDGSLHACTNQSIDQGVDSYHFGTGLSKSLGDLLSIYGGFNHFEDVAGDAISEIELRLSFNTLGNPSVSVFRDADDSLYTTEGSLSHSVDMKIADLTARGLVGNTETTAVNHRTYYAVGLGLSKAIGEAAAGVSVDLVDADDIDREFVFGTAITFDF